MMELLIARMEELFEPFRIDHIKLFEALMMEIFKALMIKLFDALMLELFNAHIAQLVEHCVYSEIQMQILLWVKIPSWGIFLLQLVCYLICKYLSN